MSEIVMENHSLPEQGGHIAQNQDSSMSEVGASTFEWMGDNSKTDFENAPLPSFIDEEIGFDDSFLAALNGVNLNTANSDNAQDGEIAGDDSNSFERQNDDDLTDVETDENSDDLDCENDDEDSDNVDDEDDKDSADDDSTDDLYEQHKNNDFIPVKFNKQIVKISSDDAPDYIQKGLKFDELTPTLKTLEVWAAKENLSLKEFVSQIDLAFDSTLKDKIRSITGDDSELFESLLEIEKGKNQKAYDAYLKARQTQEIDHENEVTSRIAMDFGEIQEIFPDRFQKFSEIPRTVIDNALLNNISLKYSLLEYDKRENDRILAAKKYSNKAKSVSMGSVRGEGGVFESDGFIKGLRSNLFT